MSNQKGRRHYLVGDVIMHSTPESAPPDAREITQDEVRAIKAARPQSRPDLELRAPALDVDLSPILSALDSLNTRVTAQEAATKDINDLLDRASVASVIEIARE